MTGVVERRHADYVTGVVDAERERVTIQEAARRLGVSESAIRKRVQRGTLQHQKGGDGRVYVYLDTGEDTVQTPVRDGLVDELRDQVTHLREQLAEEREARRRADTIIVELSRANAALAARVPALEAPSPQGAPETPESARQDAGGVEAQGESADAQAGAEEHSKNLERPTAPPTRRPWWLRMIVGG